MAKKTTYVGVVLDESGSMAFGKDKTVSGINDYTGALKGSKNPIKFTRVRFGGQNIRKDYVNTPMRDVGLLSDYHPGGGTPLFDAIGDTISEVEAQTEGKNVGVVIVIMTDGQENMSTRWTKDSIMSLISKKEEAGWQFLFLGANKDAMNGGSSIGVANSFVANYGDRSFYSSLGDTTVRYAAQSATYGSSASIDTTTLKVTK